MTPNVSGNKSGKTEQLIDNLTNRIECLYNENEKLRDEVARLKAEKAVLEDAVRNFTIPATMNPNACCGPMHGAFVAGVCVKCGKPEMNPNAGIVPHFPKGRWN